MRHLAPHIATVLGLLGLLGGLPEPLALGLILGGHIVAPIWAAKAPREQRVRAVLLGPGLLIALESLVIVVAWLLLASGNPEDTWISFYLLIIATVAVALYGVYCLIAYEVVVRGQR